MSNSPVTNIEKEILPDGWITTALGQTIHLSREKIKPENIRNEKYVGLKHIESNTGIVEYGESSNVRSTKSVFKKGDILYGRLRPYLNKVCIPSFDGICSTDILVLTTYDFLTPKFLCLYLQTTNFVQFATSQSQGVNLPRVKFSTIKDYPLPLPPLNEQKRIVSKIESIFAHIATLEVSLKSIMSQMGRYKQTVLKLAFDGKLVLQSPDTSWRCVKIAEVCELIGGGTPSRKQPKYFGGNIVWLTPTEISKTKIVLMTNSREKITKRGLEQSSAKIIPKDAVLLTSRASIGYVAIAGTHLTTNQGFMSFVCNNSIHNYFLAYWLVLNRHLLEQNASGTTFKEISKSKMREFSILLPSIPEQKRIVSKIEPIFAHIDITNERITRLQATLAILRQSVLKYAFEGNLVSQDPNDEPAYKLLEQTRGT